MLLFYQGKIFLAFAHVLPSLNDDRAAAKFYQPQGGKQSARTSTDHYDLPAIADVGVFCLDIFFVLWHLVDIHLQCKVYIHLSLSGVDAFLLHPHVRYGAAVYCHFAAYVFRYVLFVVRHLWRYAYLCFLYHVYQCVFRKIFIVIPATGCS